MDRAWFGFARLLFFVGFGIAALAKGREREPALAEKRAPDYPEVASIT
jgi:hypothetical protein